MSKAIILAAGRGSRMGAMTESMPKCLASFRGRTLLDRQLCALRQAGITEIAAITGYRAEMLAPFGLRTFHNSRWAESNMVESLFCAREWLAEDVCIVSYSDIFYDADTVRSLLAADAPIAVGYDPDWLLLWSKRFNDPLEDAETFSLRDDGSIADIGSRPDRVEQVAGQYMGLLRFSPEGWARFAETRSNLPSASADAIHMTDMIQRLVLAGQRVQAVARHGIWGEVDSQRDLDLYERDLAYALA